MIDIQTKQRAERYLATLLDVWMSDHEHVLADRVDVDPRDDFTCPLCSYRDKVLTDLGDNLPDAVVEFARTHPTMTSSEDVNLLFIRGGGEEWLHEVLGRPFVPSYARHPDPATLGTTMERMLEAATDKTMPAAEALAYVWQDWQVHRVVTGKRRNTTFVISRGPQVGLLRMFSWDFWVYTVRDVPPSPWMHKSVEERVDVLIDSVRTAQIATTVPDLLHQVANAGGVTTKGLLYAQRAQELAVREVKAAFPTGKVPDDTAT